MKETGLSINKHIYNLLTANEDLNKLVGKNIFPLVAEESVTFPFIIFSKVSIVVDYNKCGVTGDKVIFSIAIASKNYIDTVNIAEIVRRIFELHTDSYFSRITLSEVTEEYNEDAYIQALTFESIINY